MTAPPVISLADKLASFSDHWNPRIVGSYNDSELRVVKLEGEFSWHAHADTDEQFLVIAGEMEIEFEGGVRPLKQGEALVVPRGVRHRPRAAAECHVLLMDREGEPNTGASPSRYTRDKLDQI